MPNTSMPATDKVTYESSERDDKGRDIARVCLTPTSDTREKEVLCRTLYVIPIVFLPGIMGTNLKSRGEGGRTMWRPPNNDLRGTGETIGALFTYLFKNAKDRQKDLNKDKIEVDPAGPLDHGESALSEEQMRERGWGTIMRTCYHPMMGRLEKRLNAIMKYAKHEGWWIDAARESPKEFGEQKGLAALTDAELKKAASYRYEVWAGGYNWLQSNRDSGRDIQNLIEQTILPSCKKRNLTARKVIVVTHSMGGLVSRALTNIHRCDKVLGVVHGVQPATGAPAAYKRMRAGFEGPSKVVLGRDAAEVTAVLANAPGGLELLPSADYRNGQPWLKVRDGHSTLESLALPTGGDPYAEIYASKAWYGLVPESSNALLDPAGVNKSNESDEIDGPRASLNEAIKKVKTFHSDIRDQYHTRTYVQYGAQGMRSGSKGGVLGSGTFGNTNRFAWSEVAWEIKRGDAHSPIFDPRSAIVQKDGQRGTLHLADGRQLEIAPPDTPGDGTVPEPSGAAPGQAGAIASFVHGQGHAGRHNGEFGYDHQDSYNDERAIFATLYSIVKIAQSADWRPE